MTGHEKLAGNVLWSAYPERRVDDTLFNLEGTRAPSGEDGEERGYSSAGRAPALQAGGQRFEPAYLHQRKRAHSSAG